MRDFFNTELTVGDTVAFMAPGYRNLVKGTIIRFTPKMVIIEYLNNWNFSNPGYPCEIKQTPDQIIKDVNNEQVG